MDCVSCVLERSGFFSVDSQRCAEIMIVRTSWRASKLLKRWLLFVPINMATCSFPFGSQSCKMAFVHQRACGPFSPPEHKGKKKKKKKRKEKKRKETGFQSKCPSKMGPCTGCFGLCHRSWDAEETCMANWAGSRRAGVTVSLQQSHPSVMWCSVCLES